MVSAPRFRRQTEPLSNQIFSISTSQDAGRVSAVSPSAGSIYRLADLTLDTASRQVTRGGKTISLSAREFALLEYLIRNQGLVLSREKIENNLWNFDYEGGTNVVDVYIRYLRKKIDEDFSPKLIHTVRGVGYVLRCEEDAP